MNTITTHVLDVSSGFPARRVPITLERETPTGWQIVGKGATDDDGRLRNLLAPETIFEAGNYRLTFDTGAYFAQQKIEVFFPQVTVVFSVKSASQHYHVPLLLSPYGYSTYRGS